MVEACSTTKPGAIDMNTGRHADSQTVGTVGTRSSSIHATACFVFRCPKLWVREQLCSSFCSLPFDQRGLVCQVPGSLLRLFQSVFGPWVVLEEAGSASPTVRSRPVRRNCRGGVLPVVKQSPCVCESLRCFSETGGVLEHDRL